MRAAMSPSDVCRPAKPETISDRAPSWDALVALAGDTRPGTGLEVVSGRLRQGKTALLEALTAVLGGFYRSTPDPHHLQQLRHLLTLLATRGEDVTHTRPACYNGVGFAPALRAAEADGAVLLVGLDRLYRGR